MQLYFDMQSSIPVIYVISHSAWYSNHVYRRGLSDKSDQFQLSAGDRLLSQVDSICIFGIFGNVLPESHNIVKCSITSCDTKSESVTL